MKYKLGKSKSEKVLGSMPETLSEKVMKINHNFKESVKSELENFLQKNVEKNKLNLTRKNWLQEDEKCLIKFDKLWPII